MKNLKRYELIFYLFVIASAYTLPISGGDDAGVAGRVLWADLFGVAMVVFTFAAVRPTLNVIALGGICFVVSLAPGILASANMPMTIVGFFIHLFLVLIFIAGCELIRTHDSFVSLLRAVAISTVVAAFLGIYENSTSLTGLPSFFAPDVRNYRGATFRNSGQAGAFFMVALTIIVPFRFSPLLRTVSNSDRLLFNVAIAMTVICMLMTVKIASLVGIAVGAAGFAIYKQKAGFVIPVMLFVGVLYWQSGNLASVFPVLADRVTTKVSTRLDIQRVASDESFISQNYKEAWKAFEHNPLLGSGIMGFYGVFSDHEVHSTPMKLVGETGLVGCYGYLIFVWCVIKAIMTMRRALPDNPYREYIQILIPFLLGSCVSYLYTYHMRKREFWILMVVLFAALRLMDEFESSRNDSLSETLDFSHGELLQ